MYDKYPLHDVPQNNIIQRFFAQRWSAIVLEIVMTIVITLVAGSAFDLFDPLEPQAATSANVQPVELLPVELLTDTKATLAGDPLDLLLQRGADYLGQRRFVAAQAIYDLAIAIEPGALDSYRWRAYAKLQAGDYRAALDDYHRILESAGSGDFDSHNALCWAYGELGDFTSAQQHCERAVDLADSGLLYAYALGNRCWLGVEMGDYAAAAEDCSAVLAANPLCEQEPCALAHYNLGRIWLAGGEVDQALRHFDRASALGSSYAEMYLNIALVHDILGHRSAASASYQQYLALTGGSRASVE